MTKQIWVLVVLVCAALGVSWWTIQAPNMQTEIDTSQALFPNLRKHANQVNQVVITASHGQLLSVLKTPDGWLGHIPNSQEGYPVSAVPLAKLLNALADAKLDEEKTSNPAKYAVLGLQDVAVEDSLARLVTVKSDAQAWQVLIGNEPSVRAGSYFRLPNQQQVWFSEQATALPLDSYAWLRQPILSLDLASIHSVAKQGENPWQVQRAEGGGSSFVLSNLPDNAELAYEGVIDNYLHALLGLTFIGLEPKRAVGEPSSESVSELTSDLTSELSRKRTPLPDTSHHTVFVIETVNQQKITATLQQKNDKYYLTFESDSGQDYWSKWRYEISRFNGSQLDKSVDEFMLQDTRVGAAGSVVDRPVQSIDEGHAPR